MIDFYYLPASAPCRAVMMLAKAIGVRLNLKIVDILKREQLKFSFIKINPQHSIPTLNDNGFILWERAIMIYLVSRYAKNDDLYPKNPRRKSIVDQRLYFDIGTLYKNVYNTYFDVMLGNIKQPLEKEVQDLEKSLEILNIFLQDTKFVAGNCLTIADFSIVATISTAEAFGFDIARYDNVAAWYKRCRNSMAKFDFEEINITGAKILGNMYKKNLKLETG
ncbi:glutathione S-transferase 1-like isoform X2 [Leptopilina boulardi]|uniref:glutathione S-transferase 1-like isoform X2 n=1 Tax=Leptopilina boulardi TaxID=63433 RepID=UPI0021F55E5F|nr:glutathione S-transferase 1-like isoform X2 [Leptopilina boulardi]